MDSTTSSKIKYVFCISFAIVIVVILLELKGTDQKYSYPAIYRRQDDVKTHDTTRQQHSFRRKENYVMHVDFNGFEEDRQPFTSITTEQGKYGNLVPGKNHLIVFNRVPKCGSRTMLLLLEQLKIKQRISTIFSTVTVTNKPSCRQILHKCLSKEIARIRPPAVIEGHFHYIPVERSQQPIYINVIRDPLDRMVSEYNFLRFGDRTTSVHFIKHKLNTKIPPELMNETFDDCVLKGRDECVSAKATSRIISYFCGFHPNCRKPSEWSLEQAKRRVTEEYLFVGTTEDYDSTLVILEKLVPFLFEGIVNDYKIPSKSNKTEATKSFKKSPPSAEVRKIMRKKLDFEYRFYDFVKSKLEQLKSELRIS